MDNKQIGQYVRLHRRRLGLTQQELADKAGLAKNYISRVENGSLYLGDEAMQKIANALTIVMPRDSIKPDDICEE